jgi:hypothetical protein
VNLWNAKLQRIDHASAVDKRGSVTYSDGDAIEVQCVIDEPSMAQRATLGAEIKDLAQVLYVVAKNLPAGQTLASGDRVLVQPWNRSTDSAFGNATLWLVRAARAMPGLDADLTHYQCALAAAQ